MKFFKTRPERSLKVTKIAQKVNCFCLKSNFLKTFQDFDYIDLYFSLNVH